MAPFKLVVVGGGVAGVCCVEELESLLEDPTTIRDSPYLRDAEITLVTGRNGFIKTLSSVEKLGEVTESFNVGESDPSMYFDSRRVLVIQDDVVAWNAHEKSLTLSVTPEQPSVYYDKLCIATGASAKQSYVGRNRQHVYRIRDTETVEHLQKHLKSARRVLIVGNGGIATELVFELRDVEIVWAIHHSSISATYFDEAAAKFFETKLVSGRVSGEEAESEVPHKLYTVVGGAKGESLAKGADGARSASGGCALGPYWFEQLEQMEVGNQEEQQKSERKVTVIKEVELREVFGEDNLPDSGAEPKKWDVWAELTDGTVIGCDMIIEATGVQPNAQIPWMRDCAEIDVDANDGGLLVDEHMQTSIKDVYAAGDVCTARWGEDKPHWTQMRLWTQARQMGIFAARSMLIPEVVLDIAFDLFAHVTNFFGYKIVLLGDFSASKIQQPCKFHYRISEGSEYVKVVTSEHKVQGAVLVGETDLEETMENLILNQTDIRQIEEDLLNPEVDLEDYFD